MAQNIDNQWLWPMAGFIGCVDEVNGVGAQETPEFVPTRTELIRLLKYWTGVYVDYNYLQFWSATYGSDWFRREVFAHRRMTRIEALLGPEATKIIESVIAEFGKTQDQRTWNIYMNGTPKQKKHYRTKFTLK